MRLIRILIGVVMVCSLTACGGGGGIGDSGSSVAPAASSAQLNTSNQNAAAQDAMAASFMPMLGVYSLTGVQSMDESVLFNFARDQIDKLPTYVADAKANSVLAGVVQSSNVPCTNGGSLTVSFSDADNNGVVSGGDSVTIVSNGCREAAGTLAGTLGFVINSVSGMFVSANYSAGITMKFASFSVSGSQFSSSIDGDLTLSITASGINSINATLASPSLNVSGTYAGETRTRNLLNYSATFTRSPHPTHVYDSSYVIDGTLTSSVLGSQAISFATTTPFIRNSTDNYPSSGVMLLTGLNSSMLRITTQSNVLVEAALDANGDAVFDTNTLVNWNTLM
ncbi:MAG: hypothetical protein Q7T78_06680 [Rhodoferax sp.]|nr:hypothetical protein [Rhodoferax sp.]